LTARPIITNENIRRGVLEKMKADDVTVDKQRAYDVTKDVMNEMALADKWDEEHFNTLFGSVDIMDSGRITKSQVVAMATNKI
jgi:hypothetical protein